MARFSTMFSRPKIAQCASCVGGLTEQSQSLCSQRSKTIWQAIHRAQLHTHRKATRGKPPMSCWEREKKRRSHMRMRPEAH